MRALSITVLAAVLAIPISSHAAAPTTAPSRVGELKTLRSEEQQVRDHLRQVNASLDQIATKADSAAKSERPARERRLKALRELKDQYAQRLEATSTELKEMSAKLIADGKAASGSDKPAAAKEQAGKLDFETHQYANKLEDEKQIRERLRKISDEIEQLELAEKTDGEPGRARDELQDRTQERSIQLTNLQQKYQLSLQRVREEITQTESRGIAAIFPDVVDVYLSADEVQSSKPSVASARFDGLYELNDRVFVRLKSESATWTVDPAKIIAVKSRVAEK